MQDPLTQLRQQEYDLRLEISRLEQMLLDARDPEQMQTLLDVIAAKQEELFALEQQHVTLQTNDPQSGLVLEVRGSAPAPVTHSAGTRGIDTTGIGATVRLKMAHLPTAIYHLLNVDDHPLIVCAIQNAARETKRVRVTSFIEGYSAQAIDTVEIGAGNDERIAQLPSLFPDRLRNLHELTRAMLNVLVEDLDGKVELHKTEPIWLLSRNSAPLYVRDPATGEWNNLTRYLGAFVTPNEPSIMKFLRKAAARHPQKQLFGYQPDRDVETQVRAIYEALKADAGITYVNSTVNFNPEQSARTQRVRLPRQSLEEQQANCIDGTLLFASLLEAASLNPALVIVPGHALVAWETNKQSGQWDYLETTIVGESTFDEARVLGKQKADTFERLQNPRSFIRWPLRDLRAEHGITPLE
jgi:hypothetical protein